MKNSSWTRTLTLAGCIGLMALLGRPAHSDQQPVRPDLPLPKSKAPAAKKPGAVKGSRLMYTTYFYTANEAVVHGYDKDTKVRIVSLEKGHTIWKGKVGPGETQLVNTGRGTFAFLSDKKASILVGTPSQCAVVGYWVRDREGSFRSSHFYTRLPSAATFGREKVIIWAWEKTQVEVKDLMRDKTVFKGTLKAGAHHEINAKELAKMSNSVLEVRASKKAASVQVYYDEGFFVPSSDGRASGKLFHAWVGDITNSKNDLTLFSYRATAQVKVTDLKSSKLIWSGVVKAGKEHTISMAGKYVRVVSDIEISVSVAPYKHYKGAYMEHHFAAGQEGTGIENDFLLTTPQELWIFSFYDGNPITVIDAKTGKEVWKGKLDAGHAAGIHPGQGFYRVRSKKGASVMGGALACGAEFSPAGGLFEVDEALLKVVIQIKEQRQQRAAKEGRKLSDDELNAPLSAGELDQATRAVRKSTGRSSMSQAEAKERLQKMVTY